MITSKGIKYPGINLTKKIKDLCTENYRTVMKWKKRQMNERNPMFTGRLNIVKMSI